MMLPLCRLSGKMRTVSVLATVGLLGSASAFLPATRMTMKAERECPPTPCTWRSPARIAGLFVFDKEATLVEAVCSGGRWRALGAEAWVGVVIAASLIEKIKTGVSKALPLLVGTSAFVAGPLASQALTKDELSSLSYLQVKGTGLANRCPEVRAVISRKSLHLVMQLRTTARNRPML
jgi:hypothetical protein